MDISKHTHPDTLERYSFLWSEVRLLIAAVALLLGGTPVLRFFIRVPALSGFIGTILKLTWITSGLASLYLLYRWMEHGKKLFGKNETADTAAFFISVASGLNLGIVGLAGTNIGMSIAPSYSAFIITAAVYIMSARHLYERWQTSGEKLFGLHHEL